MNIRKSVAIISGVIALSACGEAQLNGPVAGADILVDLLGEAGAQHQFTRTSDEEGSRQEVGAEKWAGFGSSDKFAWLGNFDLDSAFVDAERLYLLVAQNGSDVDFDKDGEIDDIPAEILGKWRAIVEGSALRSGDASVNLLTESAYQFLKGDIDQLSEDQVREMLDTLAQQLVTDINGDGLTDYADIMAWSNGLDSENFLGDPGALEDLANAIANSGSEEEVHAAAMALWASLGIDPEQFQGRFNDLEDGASDGRQSGMAFIQSLFDRLSAGREGGDGQLDELLSEDGPLSQIFDRGDDAEGEG
jgi:hypothetical protein